MMHDHEKMIRHAMIIAKHLASGGHVHLTHRRHLESGGDGGGSVQDSSPSDTPAPAPSTPAPEALDPIKMKGAPLDWAHLNLPASFTQGFVPTSFQNVARPPAMIASPASYTMPDAAALAQPPKIFSRGGYADGGETDPMLDQDQGMSPTAMRVLNDPNRINVGELQEGPNLYESVSSSPLFNGEAWKRMTNASSEDAINAAKKLASEYGNRALNMGRIAKQKLYGGENMTPQEEQQATSDLTNFMPVSGMAFGSRGYDPNLLSMSGASDRAIELAKNVQPELRVSTRFPTGVKATENPLREQLTIGPAEMRATPTFEHNMGLLAEYPGFAHLKGLPAEDQLAGYLSQARDNLNFLYENSPDVMKQRSPSWYDGANNLSSALSERYGIPRQSSSAAIAALSPQMDWFKNASLAERVGDVIFGPTSSIRMTPEMEAFQRNSNALTSPANQKIFDNIAGKRFSDLTDPLDQALWIRLYDEAHNPRDYRSITPEGLLGDFIKTDKGANAKIGWGSLNEIEKAVRAYMSNGDMDVISPALGEKHKVRSFYNNIELPNEPTFGDVTADTHQVAAAQMRPLSGNTPAVAHNLASGLAKEKQPPNYVSEKSSSVTGVQGTYGANAEATRLAAQDQGLLPREMQSSTWEPVRELFPAKFKNAKNVEAVDNIWREKDAGNITAGEAREAIFNLAGGIGAPSWSKRGVAPVDPRRASTYR